MRIVVAALFLSLSLGFTGVAQGQTPASSRADSDRDGVSDELEQQLLLKFAPVFLISAHECDGMASEFMPGVKDPRVIAKNGTVYGQVSRNDALDAPGAFLEIHYYDLWAHDCGRAGHDLDPEHVSVLIRADNLMQHALDWKALYWYAAAHEGTACETSSGVQASFIGAEEQGAQVWISRGKHGSFLSEARCHLGCGGDHCEDMKVMPIEKLINIGEPDAPMNGAVWAASDRWSFRDKMQADFSAVIISQLDDSRPGRIVSINTPLPPTKAVILGSNSSVGGFIIGNRAAGKALSIAGPDTLNATGKALGKTGNALFLVGRKLRLFR